MKVFAVAVAALVFAAAGQAQGPGRSPWSVLAENAKAEMHLAPVCQPLPYFSSSPRRFDYGNAMWGWPEGSYASTATSSHIGEVDGHQIYQVEQTIHPDASRIGYPNAVPGAVDLMKLLLVERSAGNYCLIFDEQDDGQYLGLGLARLQTIDGEPVLHSADPVAGNGGAVADFAWAFRKGVPRRLDWEAAAKPIVEQLLPRGCTLNWHGSPWNLLKLTYRSELFNLHATGDRECGMIVIQFAVRDQQLKVVRARYVPRS